MRSEYGTSKFISSSSLLITIKKLVLQLRRSRGGDALRASALILLLTFYRDPLLIRPAACWYSVTCRPFFCLWMQDGRERRQAKGKVRNAWWMNYCSVRILMNNMKMTFEIARKLTGPWMSSEFLMCVQIFKSHCQPSVAHEGIRLRRGEILDWKDAKVWMNLWRGRFNFPTNSTREVAQKNKYH